ncbi:MAG TPA: hypothetical protein VLM38_17430 [Blastocatellia bacterium]|nr:hypothetical protein [Blastocatellia bacterium]
MSRPTAAKATNSFLDRLSCALAFALLFSLSAWAQQPTRQKTPRMTSDDVAKPPAEKPADEAMPGTAKSEEAGKAAPSKQADVKSSPEESSWRENVNKARDRAKELDRAAEQAELRITALRNDLGVSGQSARYRNETAAEMEQAGRRLSEIRGEARAAADDLTRLLDYGREKGFSEAEAPKPTSEEGKPNEQYYLSQFAKLNEELETAQRRIQLYDDRVRDLNQQLATNSSGTDKSGRKTGGDSFFAAQLLKDRDEAQQKLDEARGARTKAQSDLEALLEEARRAGVPPGLFR